MTDTKSSLLPAFLFVVAVLCSQMPVLAQVRITEFMASNSKTLADENGAYEDWIELKNESPVAVNLYEWALTDDPDDLTKWKFPGTNLPPGGFMIVFASGNDRRAPGAPLHTSFKLGAGGEYLALVDPTGTNVVAQFAPAYPPQVPDVSFGLALTASNVTLIAAGASVKALVPSAINGGSTLDLTWTGGATNEPINTTGWLDGTTGVGFGTAGGGDIGLNLQSTMLGTNASAFIRVPFVVDDPASYSLLTLRLKYDDGFVAWINGMEFARANAPDEGLSWTSASTRIHPGSAFENITLGVPAGMLRSGTNILAIQGLNHASGDASFLILPELIGTTVAGESVSGLYFTEPTPGQENAGGATLLGPGISSVAHTPNVPLDGDDLLVTAKVFTTLHPVAAVELHYRVMFDGEFTIAMFDDGVHGDGEAGDGVYGNTIPASLSTNGQMVRYFITAKDTDNTTSRLPVFSDPASTAEYFGTVVNPNYVTSALPVVHLFAPGTVLQPGPTTSRTGADSDSGGRVSLFFDGEFYDNVFMFLRGNTTADYNKKSHRIRFNTEHKFRSREPGGRLKNTSFVADYADPTYMRQGLSFWLSDQIGAPGPFYAPYRLQLNGAFYQLANHNDVHGEDLLDRLGYDADGALYNAMGTIEPPTINPDGTWTIFSNGGWEKKTRRWDTNNLDYLDLANSISESLSTGERMTNVFDRLDLPEVINYMVAARIANESDDVRANMSIYHDNDGDNLWRIVPFDMNLSWGASYKLSTAYDGIQVTNDDLKCHPFYGASQAVPPAYNWNRLYDVIIAVPQTRAMFLRRMRTVLDEYVMPPGTPPELSPIYQKAVEWRNLIAAEAALDRAWWGWPANNGQCNFDPGIDLANGVTILLNDFLAPRRSHLYGKHSVTNNALPIGVGKNENAGIPLRQPPNASISIVSWDYNPASGIQEEEYVQLSNSNSFAVDISGWELGGGIRFRFHQGTVVPAKSSIYVSPNTRAFRGRSIGPRGGQGLFVVGPYEGRLNAWGESLTLTDAARLVSSNSFPGAPSPAQRYLRITEIMYNPSPANSITNDAQQFEYIELKNTSMTETLDLNGVRLSYGSYFNFSGSPVTQLDPQETVLLVRNQACFEERFGSEFNLAGEFSGALDNGGETLRLEDAAGEKILEFTYKDAWYPVTDGLGFSLVIVNETAPWSTWNNRTSWRSSGQLGGSPGVADPPPPAISPILVTEVLTHTDLPEVDSVELFNPTAITVDIGGWFLTDDFLSPKKYRFPSGTMIGPNSHLVVDESAFNTGAKAFRFSELGESVYLFSGDTVTNLTGYFHGYEFGEAPNGVSFGDFTNSQGTGFFTLQSALTLGSPNAYPRVGPLVISEIMYHPPDENGMDNSLDEFIELQNIAATNVLLYDPGAATNTWRLRNAVDFDFPPGQALQAGARLLVVGFDPVNPTLLAAFRAKYGVPEMVPVYGPWSGKLDNSGETIELKQPDTPDVITTNVTVPFIMIDKVSYRDALPWPPDADGLGNSLQRRVNSEFGNDPLNWYAAGTSAGQSSVPDLPPFVHIASPMHGATLQASNGISISVEAGDDDGSLVSVQLFLDDAELARWTAGSSNIFWANPTAGLHSFRAQATDDVGAVSESGSVTVQIVTPMPEVTFISPAAGTIVLEDAIVNLNVASSGGSPASFVDFLLDDFPIGTVGPPFSLPWMATLPGTHTLSALPYDDEGRIGPGHSIELSVQGVSRNPLLIEPEASSWRYLDNGSNQGTAWRGLAFNDASWSTGTAQFGYGEGDEATLISYGPSAFNKYITTYFRREFVVPSLAGISGATLGVLRDDGAIAYLNGVEVFRSNMPGGTVTYQTLASSGVTGSGERTYYETNFSPARLVIGTNVLAVEVHKSSTSFSNGDLSFDARLSLQGTWLGPAFPMQPISQAVPAGGSAAFSVVVSGVAPVSLQWFFNDEPLDAFADTLILDNVQISHAGFYHVVASNVAGVVSSSPASLTVLADDSDHDGIPDAWEQANGTNPFGEDADVDLDGDGYSNYQEYIAGTSPTNGLSAMTFDVMPLNAANIGFRFDAVSNHTYSILVRLEAGTGDWQSWTNIPPAPTNRVLRVTNTLDAFTNRFFRLVTPAVP